MAIQKIEQLSEAAARALFENTCAAHWNIVAEDSAGTYQMLPLDCRELPGPHQALIEVPTNSLTGKRVGDARLVVCRPRSDGDYSQVYRCTGGLANELYDSMREAALKADDSGLINVTMLSELLAEVDGLEDLQQPAISELKRQGNEAFERELPSLLLRYPNRDHWVAYHGELQLTISPDRDEILRKYKNLHDTGDLVLRKIAPISDFESN